MHFCTVIASNYLSYTRVLAVSVRTRHPEDAFSVLVIDPAPVDVTDGELEVLRPADIGLGGDELRHMAAIYSVVELATAVKATRLRSLLETLANRSATSTPTSRSSATWMAWPSSSNATASP